MTDVELAEALRELGAWRKRVLDRIDRNALEHRRNLYPNEEPRLRLVKDGGK